MSDEEEKSFDWKEYRSPDVVGNRFTLVENEAGFLKRQILNLSNQLLDYGCKEMGESG